MYTVMSPNEYIALCAQIEQLRTQLEDASLSGTVDETLALSQKLDTLLNRLMLGRSGRLRSSGACTPADSRVYYVSTSAPYVDKAAARRFFPFVTRHSRPVSNPFKAKAHFFESSI